MRIAVDKQFLQFLPTSVQAFCQEDIESALFNIHFTVLSEPELTMLPFQIVHHIGQWKGFDCAEIHNHYLFTTTENTKYFVVTTNILNCIEVYACNLSELQHDRVFCEILQYIYQVRLLYVGGLMIHAAGVVHHNTCIAFSGESGAGKSTHANLWNHYLNAHIFNYDKPSVLLGKQTLIAGTPFGGKEHITESIILPLKAIVFIKQAKENHIQKLSCSMAFSRIYAHYMAYPINEQVSGLFEEAALKLAATVPVYELFCDISKSAVECVLHEIFGESIQEKENKYMRIRGQYSIRSIAGEYIAFPRGKAALHTTTTILLNESGAFLWKKLENETTTETLISELMQEYEIEYGLAEKDVKTFLKHLDDNGILDKGDE